MESKILMTVIVLGIGSFGILKSIYQIRDLARDRDRMAPWKYKQWLTSQIIILVVALAMITLFLIHIYKQITL